MRAEIMLQSNDTWRTRAMPQNVQMSLTAEIDEVPGLKAKSFAHGCVIS